MDSNGTALLFVGLLLSGVFFLVAASAWFKVAGAPVPLDEPIAPLASKLHRAAEFSGVALGTAGVVTLGAAFLLL